MEVPTLREVDARCLWDKITFITEIVTGYCTVRSVLKQN